MRAKIGVGTPVLGILSSKLHSTRPPAAGAGASGSVGAGVEVLSAVYNPAAQRLDFFTAHREAAYVGL